jgi:hypothetical protein
MTHEKTGDQRERTRTAKAPRVAAGKIGKALLGKGEGAAAARLSCHGAWKPAA